MDDYDTESNHFSYKIYWYPRAVISILRSINVWLCERNLQHSSNLDSDVVLMGPSECIFAEGLVRRVVRLATGYDYAQFSRV